MQVEVFTDPRKFARQAGPVLSSTPEACNVIATQVARAVTSGAPEGGVYLLVRDGDAPAGVAMHTPPSNLVVGPLEGDGAAAALVEALAGRDVSGVIGHTPSAYAVARAWTGAHGGRWTLRMDETLYAIDAMPAMPAVPGTVRASVPADRGWLTRWLDEFHLEANPYEPLPVRAGTGPAADVRLRAGGDRTMLLWVIGPEELPVSVAGVTSPQSGVSRIGPVYTPAAFRGHGYAAAVTATGTVRAFANGARRVMLYADKANPTSNGVYRRLGFRPFDEVVLIRFSACASPGPGR